MSDVGISSSRVPSELLFMVKTYEEQDMTKPRCVHGSKAGSFRSLKRFVSMQVMVELTGVQHLVRDSVELLRLFSNCHVNDITLFVQMRC